MFISKITRVILAVILATTATVTAAESLFIKVKLPHSFTIDLPSNWWAIGKDLDQVLATTVQACLDLSGFEVGKGEDVNLIAANAMPRSMYASVRIDVSYPATIAPSELTHLSAAEVSELGRETLPMLKKGAQMQGNPLIQFYGMTKSTIGKHPMLSTRYKRGGPKGPVIVEALQILLTNKTFNVNLAYRESERAIWKPVIERIKASILIGE